MPFYSLVPSFRPLLAPVPRLRLRTDTQDNYRNPPAHARQGLITINYIIIILLFLMIFDPKSVECQASIEVGVQVGVSFRNVGTQVYI